MEYSSNIAACMERYFQEQDWTYDFDSFHGIFTIEADLQCALHTARLILQLQEKSFTSFAALQTEVPPLLRASVGEYLHRANYGLPNGNFALDYDDGSIHFKTYFDCPSEEPSAEQLGDCIGLPLAVIDHYGDGLLSLLTESPASAAITRIDGQL